MQNVILFLFLFWKVLYSDVAEVPVQVQNPELTQAGLSANFSDWTHLLAFSSQHCTDYCIAARKLGSSCAAAGSASLPMLFLG